MAVLDAQNKAIIDAIAWALWARSTLTTTDKTTFVAAINEIKSTVDALGTTEHTAVDITARDAVTDLVVGDKIFVTDATADATVNTGWAIYRVQSVWPNLFFKVAEQESLDVAIVANLTAWAVTWTTYEVAISTGTNVVLPWATAVNAWLMIAADKVRFDDVSTQIATVEITDYTTYVNWLI